MPRPLAVARSRALTVLGLALVASGLHAASPAPASANSASTHLVINEFSGGNGTGTGAMDEFVELYNPTSETITFTGTIQYKSATGSTYSAVSPVTTFVVAPHGYWLAAGATYSGVAQPDSRYGFDSSASTTSGGHIALTGATTGVTTPANDPLRVDLIGWGTANAPEVRAAPFHPSVGGSLRRTNGLDTDNNSVDFRADVTRSPRSSAQDGSQVMPSPGSKTFVAGTAITPFTLTATGGPGQHTYAVTSGALPPGLTLGSTSGEVSGTPTEARAPADVTVRATDTEGDPVFVTFSIEVTASDPVVVTDPGDRSYTVGTPLVPWAFATSGGVAPYTYAVTGGWLPEGVVLDERTGEVSGTPTAVAAASEVTVTATDSSGSAGSTSFLIDVVTGEMDFVVSPSVLGVLAVGEDLVADAGTTVPAATQVTYQWRRDGVPVAGGTGSTYAVAPADRGVEISVTVTARRPGYEDATATSPARGPVVSAVFASGPTASIAGDPVAGGTLTAVVGDTTPSASSYSYAWAVGGEPSTVGGDSLSLTPAMVGKAVTVTVTARRDGYLDASDESEPTAAVARAAFVTGPSPRIIGEPVVKGTLEALTGGTVPAADQVAYQWRRDGAPVPGATDSTYVVSPADLGSRITVTVTASRAGYVDASNVSDATAAVARGQFLMGPTPGIMGEPVVGGTLTAVSGDTVPVASSYGYAWSVGGEPVAGGMDTLELTPGMVGRTVTVTITASRDGFVDASGESRETAEVAPAAFTSGPSASITGEPVVGGTLTAVIGDTVPVASSYGYAWSVGGESVAGSGPTLSLTPSMVGKTVMVTVRASRDGFMDSSDESDATAAVARAVFTTAPTVVVTGTARVGQLLSASTTLPAPAPDEIVFRWYAGDVLVLGATGPQMSLVADHAGQRISVEVVATKQGFAEAVARSSATDPVAIRSAPRVSLTVSAPRAAGSTADGTLAVLRGGKVVVSWTTSVDDGDVSLSAEGELGELLEKRFESGPVPTTGQVTVRPKRFGLHRFRLVAASSAGTAAAVAAVTVVRAPARLRVEAPRAATPGRKIRVRIFGLASNERFAIRVSGSSHMINGRATSAGVVARRVRVPAAANGEQRVRITVTGRSSSRSGRTFVVLQ